MLLILFLQIIALVLVIFALIFLFSRPKSILNSPVEIAQLRLNANTSDGRFVQALYQIGALTAVSGWTPALYRQAGDLHVQMNDLSGAVIHWEAAWRSSTEDDLALTRQIAETYLELGRWTEAIDTFEAMLELSPEDAKANYELGLLLAASDPISAEAYLRVVVGNADYGQVARALVRLFVTNPADPLISMRVGRLLADYELWLYAEQAFNYAAVVTNPNPEALAYIGLSRERQGKDGAAWISQAVTLAPDSPQVLYVWALHLRALNDTAGSLNALIEATSLDPNNPAFYAELGSAYRLVGDLNSAEYWLKIAVEISQQDPLFQQLLDQFYTETGLNN
ncbi:MAG: tetratricopeptide repeat protein [Chitinophagaceae bacterium]|nr:tetratricopeptide repeat protein [Anaerolineae bacterium]